MDEDLSDGTNVQNEGSSKPPDNVKRFKTDDKPLFPTVNQATASTSTDTVPNVKFRASPRTRGRNYRRSRDAEEERREEPTPQVETAPVDESQMDEEPDLDWIDFEEYDAEDDAPADVSGDESRPFSIASSTSDDSTVIFDTDNEVDVDDHPLFKKVTPKPWWFLVNEVNKRQTGYPCNVQSHEMFQRKCYGSLSMVKRLEMMGKLEEHEGCVNSLNFHPNGTLLASGADDLKIVVWDWSRGKLLLKYKTKHRGNVFQSKFLHLSGDLHIASCARDGQVRLAQLSSEEGVRNTRLMGAHRGPCHKLIVLPEQPHIFLSAGEDGGVLSHDVRGSKCTRILTVKEDVETIALYSIHGHPLNTHEFCVGGRDQYVRVYDQRKTSKPLAFYTPFPRGKNKKRNQHVTCAVYNHDGTEILASYSEADIFLFDTKDKIEGKFIHQYQGHRNGATIKGVNFFGPKSEYIVSGSDCGYIYMWERNSEALVQWLHGDETGVVNCLEPHPQIPLMATSGLDWDVKIWAPTNVDGPRMDGLYTTVKDNLKTKLSSSESSEINENQMLWMLWGHLRNLSRLRATNLVIGQYVQPFADSNSSASGSSSPSDTSDDDLARPANCNTS